MKIKDYWKKDALVDSSKYIDLYEDSIQNNDNFWEEHGKRIDWIKKYTKIKDVTYSKKNVSINRIKI